MSGNKWTDEQRAAIDTRGCNLLVAAAAGAGKTAVLVERIIKRITDEKDPVDIDRLLVVTFTNAAASEMRERIGDALTEALDKDPENKRLNSQLTLLNKAEITTIHSFCLDVIRNNFHSIDLDPGFRISDDTETLLLKMETLQELFDEMYEKGNEDFLSLVECYGGIKDDSGLLDMVLNLYEFAKSSPWPEKWLYNAAEAFNVGEDFKFGDSIWAKVISDSTKIELNGLLNAMERAVFIIKNSEGLEPYLDSFLKEIEDIRYLISCADNWEKLYDGIINLNFNSLKRCGKNADKNAKDTVLKIRDDAKSRIKALKDSLFTEDSEKIVSEIKTLYPLMKALSDLVIEFDRKYSEKKREKGIIDFNDIEHFALQILTQEDEKGNIRPSEIALMYREKYEEILIDEYQDSNLIQEVILSTIARDENPNRFMVGDVKQSIYRFRQSKPELFLEKYNTYSKEEGHKNKKIMLYKNFRSRAEIIEAVNYIFKKIMSENIGELDYTDKEKLNYGANFSENNEAGIVDRAVEVHLIEKSADVLEQDIEGDIEDNENNEEDEPVDNIQLEARVILQRIKELMGESESKRFIVYDKNVNGYRPVEYRDIVILLRATARWAMVFLEELTNAGIPAFADTGTGYFETPEIKTIISLLQVIDNPMQDIPLLAVLKSPIFSFGPEELIDIRMEEPDKTIYEALKKASTREDELGKKTLSFLTNLKKWQDRALHLPVDEFLWYLYRDTGYYGYVGAMAGGVQRQANLRVLFERAKQYEETSFKGLFNFINFINRLKVSSGDMGSAKILGENENVVRIMSIHKSKGLEFPVVIAAGMGKQFNFQDLRRSILYHHELGLGPDFVDYKRRIAYPSVIKEAIKKKIRLESLSEEMRILYVAFTRAKEKLIITGSVADIKKTASKWGQSLAFDGKLPEFDVLKAKNYFDWICPAIMRHRDLKALRDIAEIEEVIEEDSSKWEVRIWGKKDALFSKKEINKEELNVMNELERIDINGRSSEFAEEITRRLDYSYPYKKSSSLPAKLSVTEIKRILNEEVLDENTTSIFEKTVLKTPAFLEERKGLNATERGAVMHLIMQKLDLNNVLSLDDIIRQIKVMVDKEILTEVQAGTVNVKRIEGFFKSPLGIRMLNSGYIRREVPFHIELKSTEIYKDLPEEYEGELIAVQGIIDCFFEEDGEIVLLDYKTDYVTDENINEIREKYKVQIDLYAKALEKITGKKVKEKYIYLFYNGEILRYY